MEEKKRTYSDDLKIDPDALDVEWLNQPDTFMRYAKKASRANNRLRRAEEAVKVLRSQLVLECTKNPKKVTGSDKMTAQQIEAYYRTRPEYIAAKEEWLVASFDADIYNNAVSAFHQRRYALQDLVQLHGQSYFAGPLEPRDLGKESQNRDKMNRNIKEALAKK